MSQLGKLCQIFPGKTPAKAAYSNSGNVKIIKFRDVLESGVIDFNNDEEGWVDSRYVDISDLVELTPGTILLTNAAHSTEHIGKKVAYLEAISLITEKICFVGELTGIRACSDDLSTKWLYYWLQTSDAKREIARTVEGAHLIPRQFKRIKLPSLSIDEQKQHLKVFERLDDAIAKARAELEATIQLKYTLLKRLFSYGVNQDSDLYESKWVICPAHWKILKLKSFADVAAGFTMGRNLSRDQTVEVPYVTVINVQDGRFALENVARIEIKREELETDLLKFGDILMTEGGDRDKLGRGGMWQEEVTPCAYQNHIFRVRLNQSVYKPELFHYLIQTYQAKRYFFAHAKQTSNLCTINSRELKNWPISIPPMDEQEEMVKLMNTVEDQLRSLGKHQDALIKVKQSLLHNLLTGKIRIPPETVDVLK